MNVHVRSITTMALVVGALAGPSEVSRADATRAQYAAPVRAEQIATDDGSITATPALTGGFALSTAYDAVHQRIFLFGGVQSPQAVWVKSLSGSSWTPVPVAGAAPSFRGCAAMIYDPLRERLILFGGQGQGGYVNDVWALSLSGNPQWSVLAPGGSPPSPRGAASAVYDPPRDRMVVFGGGDGAAMNNNVFALSLGSSPEWTALAVAGAPPAARIHCVAIHDPIRDRAVFYGGSPMWPAVDFTDTWELSLSTHTWSPVLASGSPPSATSGIYDALRDRMVIYRSATDVWALSFVGPPQWQSLPATGTVPPRSFEVAFPNPAGDAMWIFGGIGEYAGQPFYLNDTWSYSFSSGTWSVEQYVQPPLQDLAPAEWTVLDSRRQRMIMLLDGQCWALSLDNFVWDLVAPSGSAPALTSWSAIYDPIGDRVILFGQGSGGGPVGETWALELTSRPSRKRGAPGGPYWVQLAPGGVQPPARLQHAAVLDTLGDRMIVFGGGGSNAVNDAWSLDLFGPLAWTQLTPAGSPPPAGGATAIYDESAHRVVVSAGPDFAYPQLWILSLVGTPTWTPGPAASPGRRYVRFYDGARHRALALDNGEYYGARYHALDLGTLQWSDLGPVGISLYSPYNAVFDRRGHRVVIYADWHCSGGGFCTKSTRTFLWSFGPPAVSVDLPAIDLAPSRVSSIDPSPAHGPQRIAFRIAPGDAGRALEVYSVDGRRVWSAPLSGGASGTVTWNGRTAAGAPVPAAVYFARLTTARGAATRRFVRL